MFFVFCRFLRQWYRRICYLLMILMVGSVLARAFRPSEPEFVLTEGVYMVDRAVDGDTLLLTNGCRIRLLGVDTPETVKPNTPVEPFGPEASEYTKQAIAQSGNRVYIRLDKERQDKYGRYLGFIFLGKSDEKGVRFLNEELIREGLSRAVVTFNYSMSIQHRLLKAQKEAIENNRGIWSLPKEKRPKPPLHKWED